MVGAKSLFSPLFFLQLVVDYLIKILQAPELNQFPVYEQGRCARDFGQASVIDVPINDILYGGIVHVPVEGIHIELEVPGDILYRFVVHAVSQFEQLVMKFQKFPLLICGECGGRGLSREGMHGEREVLENELYVFRIFLQQLLEERLKPRAVWSLVVAEDHQGDFGLLRALVRQSVQGKMPDNRQLDYL